MNLFRHIFVGMPIFLCFCLLPYFVFSAVAQCPATYNNVTNVRGQTGNQPIPSLIRNYPYLQYDYSPSVMLDLDGKYKVWWCGSNWTPEVPGGDQIWYSESTSFNGPWSTPISVFHPGTFPGGFDANFTCDPSVVRVNGYYYLYYTGITTSLGDLTKIGVVRSSNGISWQQFNGGVPIVLPKDGSVSVGQGWYGAGYPSVVVKNDWFYMLYMDDTGVIINGQSVPVSQGFVLRSKNPAFAAGEVQQLRNDGGVVAFYPYSSNLRYPIWNTTNADLVFHDGLRMFIVGNTGIPDQLSTIFFNDGFAPQCSSDYFSNAKGLGSTPMYWTQGPGLVRSPSGRAIFDFRNLQQQACIVAVDGLRSVGAPGQENSPTWDLGWAGADITLAQACGNVVSDTPKDFDGDRMSDPVVYRRSTPGYWWRNSTTGDQIHSIGSASSSPIVGDFDGDGRTDRAVVTPHPIGSLTYFDWRVEYSHGGVWLQPTWGLSTDQIAVGDYNGDGLDDIGAFRASTGTWWVVRSTGTSQSGSTSQSVWGQSGDLATPEDFDADGKDDLAIFRPSTGQYWIWYSGGGSRVESLGDGYCLPVVGDYNGDGRADIAHWRSKNQKFYVRDLVSGSTWNITWGLLGDRPVKGDFNGDGRLDLSLWRPSNGTWYISYQDWALQNGTSEIQWGLSTDLLPLNQN